VQLTTDSNTGIERRTEYKKLCICIGAQPKLLIDHASVIGLRDQHSVEDLLRRLATARTVAIVGNGGIALELIHEVPIFISIVPPGLLDLTTATCHCLRPADIL
jgi:hypothetical protein